MTRRWTRRSALVLGLSGLGVTLTAPRAPADARAVLLGGFRFEVPTTVRDGASVPGITEAWPFQGAVAAGVGPAAPPPLAVLARADLASTDAEEVLGLLLSGAAIGHLPGLMLQPRRSRIPGGTGSDGRGTEQVRIDLDYQVNRRVRYRGTLLVAVRPQAPAAVLVVLGDDTLTAGTAETILDSARWIS